MRQAHLSVFVAAITLCLLGLLSAPSVSGAQARGEITVLEMSPASPATLAPGDKVKVVFRYDIRSEAPFRIFVRPMTGESPAEDYAVSGSPLYDPGRGGGRADFTLRSPGKVDRLRIVAAAEDSDRHLVRSYADVSYRFESPDGDSTQVLARSLRLRQLDGESMRIRPEVLERTNVSALAEIYESIPPATLQELGTYRPPIWRPLPETTPPEVPPSDDGMPVCSQIGVEPKPCEEVAGRRVTEDGVVIVDCADGSTWRTTAEGDVFTTHEGRSCRDIKMMLMSGTALPPAEPPAGMSAAQWAQQLDAWLNHSVANHLLARIRTLLGEPHFSNYQNLEARSTHNLYQKIDYRLAFLDKLMDGR